MCEKENFDKANRQLRLNSCAWKLLLSNVLEGNQEIHINHMIRIGKENEYKFIIGCMR